MKQSWLWVLLPLGVALTVFALFFTFFFASFISGETPFSPVALFALSLMAGSYAVVRGFRLGWSVSLIISAVIALIALLAACAGLAFGLQGMRLGAIISGVVTVAGLGVLLVSNGMDEVAAPRRKTDGVGR